MRTTVDTVANSNGAVVPLAIEILNEFPIDLTRSHIETRFPESNESQKLALAFALARYGKVDIDFLVNAIDTASAAEVDNLAAALGHSQKDAINALRKVAEACDADRNWNRKQRLAIVALQMGDPSIASDMCQLRPDRLQRLDFILAWPAWHGDLGRLARFADGWSDPALRSFSASVWLSFGTC